MKVPLSNCSLDKPDLHQLPYWTEVLKMTGCCGQAINCVLCRSLFELGARSGFAEVLKMAGCFGQAINCVLC
jgi:hypothetical protein